MIVYFFIIIKWLAKLLDVLFYILCVIWMVISWFIATIIMNPIRDKVDMYGIVGLFLGFATLAISIAIGIRPILFLKELF